MRPSSQQTTAQSSYNAITELNSQIEFIRSSIQECVLTYPSGEAGFTGYQKAYPLLPVDAQFTTPAANNQVQYIGCPGNPGDSADHASIFGGASGKFLPPPPNLFDDWIYYKGDDGIFFYTRTDKTDAFLQTALAKLDENYSECQADIIDASSADIELTSRADAADPKCLEGSAGATCFRVWVIADTGATYQAGGEEATAGCP